MKFVISVALALVLGMSGWLCNPPSVTVENTNINRNTLNGGSCSTCSGDETLASFVCVAAPNGSEAVCSWNADGPVSLLLEATDGDRVIRSIVSNGGSWDIVASDDPTTWTICAVEAPGFCSPGVELES